MQRIAAVALIAVTAGVCAAGGCQAISGASATRFAPIASIAATGSGGAGLGGAGGKSAATGAGGAAGAGGMSGCKTENCPGVDTGCDPRACLGGLCATSPASKDSPCSGPNNEKVCDGMGNCVACNSDLQCSNGSTCSMAHTCEPPGCHDAKKDGDETDVDCGGSCAPCATGKSCNTANDCQTGYCPPDPMGAGGAGGSSSASSGSGGAGGAGGAGGGMGAQTIGHCAPCTNDNECAKTAYCVNEVCILRKQNGLACGAGRECLTGFCADTVCCESACAAACVSCFQKDTGDPNGTCTAVKPGTDPNGDCKVDPSAPCGPNGQQCNGDPQAPGCVLADKGTACAQPTCNGDNAIGARTCDGAGQCGPGLATSCAPYQCENASCPAMCALDTDCILGDVCDHTNHCIAPQANGAACTESKECATKFCIDGFCCDQACTDSCQGCAQALTGQPNGSCGDVTANTQHVGQCDDTHGMCPGGDKCTCNGADVCDDKQGQSCMANGQCATGHCVDGVCCNSVCSGPCDACTMMLGAPADGTCGAAAVKSQPNPNDCDNTTLMCGSGSNQACTCDANGNCLGAKGVACNNNNQCASNKCDTLLTHQCQ